MSKFKVTMSKFFEEIIEAESKEEAYNLAWKMWIQEDQVDEAYCYEVEE